jgi:hypothetical protein
MLRPSSRLARKQLRDDVKEVKIAAANH